MGPRKKGQRRPCPKPLVREEDVEQQIRQILPNVLGEKAADFVPVPFQLQKEAVKVASRRKQDIVTKEDKTDEGVDLVDEKMLPVVAFKPSTSKPFVPHVRSRSYEVIDLVNTSSEEEEEQPRLKTAECQTSPNLPSGEINNNLKPVASPVHSSVARPVAIVLPNQNADGQEEQLEVPQLESVREDTEPDVFEESLKEDEIALSPETAASSLHPSTSTQAVMIERRRLEDSHRVWRPRRETLLTASSSVQGLVSLKDLVNVPTPMLLAALGNRKRRETSVAAVVRETEAVSKDEIRLDVALYSQPQDTEHGEASLYLQPQNTGEGVCLLSSQAQYSDKVEVLLSSQAQDSKEVQAGLSSQAQDSKDVHAVLSSQAQDSKEVQAVLSSQPHDSKEVQAALSSQPQDSKEVQAALSSQAIDSKEVQSALSSPAQDSKEVQSVLSSPAQDSKEVQSVLSSPAQDSKEVQAVLPSQPQDTRKVGFLPSQAEESEVGQSAAQNIEEKQTQEEMVQGTERAQGILLESSKVAEDLSNKCTAKVAEEQEISIDVDQQDISTISSENTIKGPLKFAVKCLGVPAPCPVCHNVLSTYWSLKRHIQRVHKIDVDLTKINNTVLPSQPQDSEKGGLLSSQAEDSGGGQVVLPSQTQDSEEREGSLPSQAEDFEDRQVVLPSQLQDSEERKGFLPSQAEDSEDGQIVRASQPQDSDEIEGPLPLPSQPQDSDERESPGPLPSKAEVSEGIQAVLPSQPQNSKERDDSQPQDSEEIGGSLSSQAEDSEEGQVVLLAQPQDSEERIGSLSSQAEESEEDKVKLPSQPQNSEEGQFVLPSQPQDSEKRQLVLPLQPQDSDERESCLSSQAEDSEVEISLPSQAKDSEVQTTLPSQAEDSEEGQFVLPSQPLDSEEGQVWLPLQPQDSEEGQVWLPLQPQDSEEGQLLLPLQPQDSEEGQLLLPLQPQDSEEKESCLSSQAEGSEAEISLLSQAEDSEQGQVVLPSQPQDSEEGEGSLSLQAEDSEERQRLLPLQPQDSEERESCLSSQAKDPEDGQLVLPSQTQGIEEESSTPSYAKHAEQGILSLSSQLQETEEVPIDLIEQQMRELFEENSPNNTVINLIPEIPTVPGLGDDVCYQTMENNSENRTYSSNFDVANEFSQKHAEYMHTVTPALEPVTEVNTQRSPLSQLIDTVGDESISFTPGSPEYSSQPPSESSDVSFPFVCQVNDQDDAASSSGESNATVEIRREPGKYDQFNLTEIKVENDESRPSSPSPDVPDSLLYPPPAKKPRLSDETGDCRVNEEVSVTIPDEVQEGEGTVDNIEFGVKAYRCRICLEYFYSSSQFVEHFESLHKFDINFDYQLGKSKDASGGELLYGGVEDYEKILGCELPGKPAMSEEDEAGETSSDDFSSTSEDSISSPSSSDDEDLHEEDGDSASDFFEEELKGNLDFVLRTVISSDEDDDLDEKNYDPRKYISCSECNRLIHRHNVKRHYTRFHPQSLSKWEQAKQKGHRKVQPSSDSQNVEDKQAHEEETQETESAHVIILESSETAEGLSSESCVRVIQVPEVSLNVVQEDVPNIVTENSLGEPSKTAHQSRNVPTPCPSCHKVLSSYWSLRRHTQQVHGFLVTKANSTVKDKSQKIHAQPADAPAVGLPCPVCSINCKDLVSLQGHLARKHVPYTQPRSNSIIAEPSVQCRICCRFVFRSELISHLQDSHRPATIVPEVAIKQNPVTSLESQEENKLETAEVRKRPLPGSHLQDSYRPASKVTEVDPKLNLLALPGTHKKNSLGSTEIRKRPPPALHVQDSTGLLTTVSEVAVKHNPLTALRTVEIETVNITGVKKRLPPATHLQDIHRSLTKVSEVASKQNPLSSPATHDKSKVNIAEVKKRLPPVCHLQVSHKPVVKVPDVVPKQNSLLSLRTQEEDKLEIVGVQKRAPPTLQTLLNLNHLTISTTVAQQIPQPPPLRFCGKSKPNLPMCTGRLSGSSAVSVPAKPSNIKVSIVPRAPHRPATAKMGKVSVSITRVKNNKVPQMPPLSPTQIQCSMNSVIRPLITSKPPPVPAVRVKGPPPPDECPKCHRIFADVKEALTHKNNMLYEHRSSFGLKENARLGCNFCSVTFELWESACLRVHVDKSHSVKLNSVKQQGIPRIFRCAVGPCRDPQGPSSRKSFFSIDALISHVWTHRVKPPKQNGEVNLSASAKIGASENPIGNEKRNNEP